jgi:signal transduction histidine kinase
MLTLLWPIDAKIGRWFSTVLRITPCLPCAERYLSFAMPSGPRTPGWSLLVAFTAVAASFVGATLYTTYSSQNIDAAALSIATNATPSISHLAAARSDLRELQSLLARALEDMSSGRPYAERSQIEHTRAALAGEITAYLSLTPYPGEKQLWSAINQDLEELNGVTDRLLAKLDAHDLRAARDLADRDFHSAVDRTASGMLAAIELNAENASELADRIERQRHRALLAAFGLDGLAVVLTLFAGLLALRAVRKAERYLEAHNRLLADRAEELEQFASRVSHDILSPLGAAGLVFSIFDRKLPDDPTLRDLNARGVASVQRVQRIVDGLLEFARAGARPQPNARADVREIVLDVTNELRPIAAEALIDLAVDQPPQAAVAASPGILTSMLSNLIRNAIKYMGDAQERRIHVRFEERPDRVHFEVSDTGPGLPEELGTHVFEPYVRGRHSKQPGIGLGLATVRRMAEAHGGRVGVESRPCRGACFWFDLPRASREVEIPQPPPQRHAPN